jgi:hypothetical protein
LAKTDRAILCSIDIRERTMGTKSKVEGLRSLARQALEVQDRLLQAWTDLAPGDCRCFDEPGDRELLEQLILRRIYPVNAFALLVQIDKQAAIDVLLRRYLGDTVDPDTKFGGYAFELSTMLDDLREAHGESALRELVNHPMFNKRRLNDDRVVEAFTDSLGIDKSRLSEWLKA